MTASAFKKIHVGPVIAAIPFAFFAFSAGGQDLLPDQVHTLDSALEAYLADEGEDLDACFEEFPELTNKGLGLPMQSGEAQNPLVEPRRVVLALDASGSMAATVAGETKMAAARDAAQSFLATLPDDVEVGLVVFGHQGTNQQGGRAESCQGVETLSALDDSDREGIAQALSEVEATGWTPLAAAIAEAGANFISTEVPGEQVVYVISDGEETCDGDPVAAARNLAESDVRAVVNIIGFDLPQAERDGLMAVAQAGNGVFFEAATGDDLRNQLANVRTDLANMGALARTTLATGGGQARNTLATEGMLSRAYLCLGASSAREFLGVARWVRENDADPALITQMTDALNERHERYNARYNDIATEARSLMDDANTILQDDLDRAQQEFNSLSSDSGDE